MLKKIAKLKDRSFAEILDRGRQTGAMYAERFGFSRQLSLPSDAEIFRSFDLSGTDNSDGILSEHLKKNPFYPSFSNRESTIRVLRKEWPFEEERIVAKADRICDGFFDLLGYEGLFFGSVVPNWHLDPTTGITARKVHWSRIDLEDPQHTGNKKIVWELNRHQYFLTLGQAYWLTGNERYANTFIEHFESWCSENPPKIGINWLSSLELAFRAMSWIWAFRFFRDSPALAPDHAIKMLKVLHAHGRHIESFLSTYFSPNTHLTGEALGLYFLGMFFSGSADGGRWKELGYSILMEALDFQVRDDGVYCEQSTHYHRYTTDFYTNLLILRRAEGLPIESKHSLKLNGLYDFLLHVVQPDGTMPLIGDDDGGKLNFLDGSEVSDVRPTLALGAAILDRQDLKFASGAAAPELLWLLGEEGLSDFNRIEAREPEEKAKAFPESGYYTLRNSWNADADHLVISCGVHGFMNAGHAHADTLSFVLSMAGESIFMDPGTYCYTDDPDARRKYRSASAHNCLTVNGDSTSIPDGPFSWKTTVHGTVTDWESDGRAGRFRGTHNGFFRFGVKYTREIEYWHKGEIMITDEIESTELNRFELNFILSPEIVPRIVEDHVLLGRETQADLETISISATVTSDGGIEGGNWKIEPFEVSPKYGKLVPSHKLMYVMNTEGAFRISCLIRSVRS